MTLKETVFLSAKDGQVLIAPEARMPTERAVSLKYLSTEKRRLNGLGPFLSSKALEKI